MEEKVSIIVPIYNVEKYVIKCLDSLINQTYKNIIIYAISDGSPDNSVKLINEKKYPNNMLRLIEKENGGYGSVLEYAINLIDTKYFMICDPDDYLEVNAVEELMKKVVENNLDIVIGDKYVVYENSTEKKVVTYTSKIYNIQPDIVYENKEIGKLSFLDVSPHSKIFKTELVKNLKFPHKVSYTDFILYIVALNRSKRVMYVNKPYAYYLIDRPGNTTVDINPKRIEYYIKVWNSCFDNLNSDAEPYNYILHRLFNQYRVILRLTSNVTDKNMKEKLRVEEKNMLKRLSEEKKILKNVLNGLKGKMLYYIYIKKSKLI